jgi:hypothetical protein
MVPTPLQPDSKYIAMYIAILESAAVPTTQDEKDLLCHKKGWN